MCVSPPSWNCQTCDRKFRSLAARDSHKVACKQPKKQPDERLDDPPEGLELVITPAAVVLSMKQTEDQLDAVVKPKGEAEAKVLLVADAKAKAQSKEVNDLKNIAQTMIDVLQAPVQARP